MWKFLAILALLMASAGAAQAQTPAATVAATPSADTAEPSNNLAAGSGGQRLDRPVEFSGGLQIGTSAAGASKITFLARGTCIVNPNTLSVGADQSVTCAVTGAASGDAAFAAIATTAEAADVVISRVAAETNAIRVVLSSFNGAANAGDITINYLVVR